MTRTAQGLVIAFLAVTLAGLAFAAVGTQEGAAPADTGEGSSGPRLDIVFCVDTTGSMSDEIEVVKTQMRDMVAKIAGGEPTPDVRFGLVIYRDRGDEYVTKHYELTRDLDVVVGNINDIVANKGGDYAESMNEALHVAVQEMNWDTDVEVGRMILLIADAPPHMDYEDDYSYLTECEEALGRGIVIDTIGCSGLKEPDQKIFEEIASLTLGAFELLTYAREFVDEGGEKRVVMWAGGEAYALDDAAADGDWREGATLLASRGKATKMAGAKGVMVVEGAGSGGYGGGGRAPGGDEAEAGEMIAALPTAGVGLALRGTAGPAGVDGPRGRVGELSVVMAGKPMALGTRVDVGGHVDNNLAQMLTRRAQQRLARQGVRFADQPYLVRKEWQGGTCDQTKRDGLVVRTQAEWERVWALVAKAEDAATPPSVDFERDMVLVAFAGESWRGRSVKIEDVWEEDDGLHVRVGRGGDDPEAKAPYHMIVVSSYEGEVVWK